MKKSLHLLVAGAMFAAGAMTASADRYYQRGDEAVDAFSIEAGVQYVLNCARPDNAGEKAFLFGTENLTANCIYTFEEAGKAADGSIAYYIKNNEGHYFTMPGRAVGYTDNKDNAWRVTIKPFTGYESDYEFSTDDEDLAGINAYIAESKDSGEDGLLLNDATYFTDSDAGVVIASATPDDAADAWSTYTYLLGVANGATSGNVTRGTNYQNNVWVVYTVEQQSAEAYLESVLLELFGDEGWNPDEISTGKNPGDYDPAKVDAVTEAYENAISADESNAEALADAVKKAYEEFKASFVNFGPGYYIFTTFRSSKGALFDNTDNVSGCKANLYTYSGPAVAITHTKTGGNEFSIGGGVGQGFDTYLPESEDPENEWMKTAVAPYIVWKVIESDTPGMYYVQNYQTGQYIGGAPKNDDGSLKPSNAPILLTKNPEAKYNMAPTNNRNDEGVLCWKFYSDELTKKSAWGGGWEMGGLHAPGDVLNLVTWNSETDGSCWVPRTVTEEMLKAIDEYKLQPMLNMNLKNLKEEAEEFVEDTKVYNIFDLATGKAAEGLNILDNIDVDGLVTSPEQLSSNAAETNEGPIENLVDGDFGTFFHSAWSDAAGELIEKIEVEDPETGEITEEYPEHNLMMDLLAPYQQLTFKWFTRHDNNTINGRPVNVTIFASNDGENWTEICKDTFHYYGTKVQVAGEQKNSYIGLLSVDLKAKYQHVRIDVENDGMNNGKYGRWMNASEFRVYEGLQYEYKYDKENSPFESVPADIVAELEKQLETAATELEDQLATQETIDALQKAFDAFKEHTPNPQALRDLITNATDIHDSAEAGDQPGYFTQEAIDALQKAIDEAEGNYSGSMTVEEVTNAKNALQAALDAFEAALIKPENGIYMIKSKSENENNFGAYVYAQNSSKTSKVAKGYAGKDEVAATVLGAYWQVEKLEGGFAFKNLYTGLYLAPVGNKTDVVAQSEAPYVYTLQFAQEPGCFNAVIAEEDAYNGTYIYLNMQPGGGMVTWGSAKGRDNSAFEFVPVDESDLDKVISDGYTYNLEIKKAAQIATFPVDLYLSSIEDVKFYSVIGQTEDFAIQLKETEEVKAGQAYILIPTVEEAVVTLFTEAETVAELKPVTEVGEAVNGLVPVFTETVVPKDCGLFTVDHSKVTFSEGSDDDTVKANTGYFNLVPNTTEKGTAFIPASAMFDTDGIQNIIMNSDVEKGIYSISGVRVNSLKNLPAGLYIINGKKYIVK
ncbi:MAG: discoidin domain-containing protein [Bacteroidales bacterium]|nr:discoidin domain-containing protein [Bacteroidales bacterium]